jgi:hypothetical protein
MYYVSTSNEGFKDFLDLSELEPPLNIQNECAWKDTDNCDGDIPLNPVGCNNVPGFPKGLEPKANTVNNVEYPEVPFNRLAPKSGNYTFIIPELKYDGIYSRRLDRNNKCCWTTEPNKPETYGANVLFHVPKKSFLGRTLYSFPECEGYPTGYPPRILIEDCKERTVPCSISRKITI